MATLFFSKNSIFGKNKTYLLIFSLLAKTAKPGERASTNQNELIFSPRSNTALLPLPICLLLDVSTSAIKKGKTVGIP